MHFLFLCLSFVNVSSSSHFFSFEKVSLSIIDCSDFYLYYFLNARSGMLYVCVLLLLLLLLLLSLLICMGGSMNKVKVIGKNYPSPLLTKHHHPPYETS